MKLDGRLGYCVVLTATVTPNASARLARAAPGERLQDYLGALKFWLHHPDPRLARIVLLENSGHSLEGFRELIARDNPLKKTVELLPIECGPIPSGVDYGFSESEMLDLGVARSALVRQSRFIIKATGRLTFDGLSALLDHLPAEFDFAVEARTWRFGRRMPVPWVQAQLLLFSTEFFEKHLVGLRHRMAPGWNLEAALAQLLLSFRGSPGALLRWPRYVRLRGISGFYGVRYDSLPKRIADGFRVAARVFAPDWWI